MAEFSGRSPFPMLSLYWPWLKENVSMTKIPPRITAAAVRTRIATDRIRITLPFKRIFSCTSLKSSSCRKDLGNPGGISKAMDKICLCGVG